VLILLPMEKKKKYTPPESSPERRGAFIAGKRKKGVLYSSGGTLNYCVHPGLRFRKGWSPVVNTKAFHDYFSGEKKKEKEPFARERVLFCESKE